MIVVFFIAAFLFQRKSEDANYSVLIWLIIIILIIIKIIIIHLLLAEVISYLVNEDDIICLRYRQFTRVRAERQTLKYLCISLYPQPSTLYPLHSKRHYDTCSISICSIWPFTLVPFALLTIFSIVSRRLLFMTSALYVICAMTKHVICSINIIYDSLGPFALFNIFSMSKHVICSINIL